jgi:uncharacterized protein involved in exopolysaccharide biosynthesis
MKAARLLAAATLLVPLAAAAQAYYAQARPLLEPALTRSELRECMYRDEALAERRADLDGERAETDAEAAAIAEAGARLADELRNIHSGDVGAVAAYNARSAAHNERVQEHNRQVAVVNERAARLNGESARLDTVCARPFYPSDRDSILMERSSIR